MAIPDKFPEVLQAALAKVLPDEQSQAAARALLDKHRDRIRTICCVPSRMGVRVAEMNRADDELLDGLDALTDTEQPHEVEQGPDRD